MDNLRGAFDSTETADDNQDWDSAEEQDARDLPPDSIGQDERRMQVRAYNHWASLLGERNFPPIEALEPENLPDFGPYSVVLDFSNGIDDPAVQFLGDSLADECGAEGDISQLSDVPPRSLLSRITDHYMQILANQAPIGFEAEFVNQRGIAILYRGILLPFSSNNEAIDFIYGVINWKEMADQVTADELLLEIDQALETEEEVEAEADEPQKHPADPVTEWADAPANEASEYELDEVAANSNDAEIAAEEPANDTFELDAAAEITGTDPDEDSFGSLAALGGGDAPAATDDDDLPMPNFGDYALPEPDEEDEEDEDSASYSFASLTDYVEAPAKKTQALDLDAVELDENEFESGDEAYELDGDEVDESVGEPTDDFENDDADTGYVLEEEPVSEGADGDEPVESDFVSEEAASEEPEPVFEAPVETESETNDAAAGEPEIAPAPEPVAEQVQPEFDEPVELIDAVEEDLPEDAGLYDCLASARELAHNASASEDRSRKALYAAVGRAYDFSLAAQEAPEDYDELVAENGLTVQDRAPMTPVVKLVFGSDYDKTRLTEYAAVLTHAHRVGLERGSLAKFLGEAEGGLKGVVSAERKLRREEAGKEEKVKDGPREALAKKLRELEAMMFEALDADGPEFGLVMIRRSEDGEVEVLGEIEQDVPMIERAARKLVG